MERRESVLKVFQELDCKVENDAILDKCSDLCDIYDMNIEKFTELWLTFCVNEKKDSNPTLDTLLEMEKAILKKDDELDDSSSKSMETREEESMDKHFGAVEAVDDVLRMYGCKSAGLGKRKQTDTETETDTNPNVLPTKVKILLRSPSTENLSTPDQRNVHIREKDKIVISLGKAVASWKRTEDDDIEVEQSNEPHVPSNVKYMYDVLAKQGNILTNVCRCLGNKLLKLWLMASGANSAEMRYEKHVRSISQTYFRTFGRINAKKESANIVMLEGSTRRNGTFAADSIELDFRNVKQYSVFSGQIVAVEATNPLGDTLYVKELFTKAYAPPAPTSRLKSRINIFVAAGPFTAANNLQYQQLWNLMEKVALEEPHILILIGPFLEYGHPEIDSLKGTYQNLFETIVMRIMESIKSNTQVVLVASNRDAQQEPIYPTPQYAIENQKFLQNHSRLKLMPDPCILDVEGLKIGITSVDVIKHIGNKEISNISGMDRLSRLADHVLAQTCFYPVYPPSQDLNVDVGLWEKYTFFDQQPHLMILPSDMRCYCKVINNCVTLNPERLHKHTYARLSIKPSLDAEWSSDNISCDIIKSL